MSGNLERQPATGLVARPDRTVKLGGTGRVADDLYLLAHHEATGKPHLQPLAAGLGLAGGLLAEFMLPGTTCVVRHSYPPLVSIRHVARSLDTSRGTDGRGNCPSLDGLTAVAILCGDLLRPSAFCPDLERILRRRAKALTR